MTAAGAVEDLKTLSAMTAEHSAIDPLLAACTAGFDAMVSGGNEADRSALGWNVAATQRALEAHLAHEETDAMRILQERLTDAEWRQIDKASFGKDRSFAIVRFAVPWLLFGLDNAHRKDIIRRVRSPILLLWWVFRRGYAQRHRSAFGY